MILKEVFKIKGKEEIIREFNVNPNIIVKDEIEKRVDFLKDYLIQNPKLNGYLLGISGGIDSAVAAALVKMATDELGKKFIGVLTPYHNDPDISDMYDVINAVGMEHIEINIGPAVDAGIESLNDNPDKLRIGNRKARQRMIEWYDIAQKYGLVVIGTDHATESIVGYYTKYGDGGVDILPLKTLHKRQIREIAKTEWPFGKLPEKVISKPPSAGLWPNQTDEQELGITYDEICDYLEGKEVSEKAVKRIESLYKISWHKRNLPGI